MTRGRASRAPRSVIAGWSPGAGRGIEALGRAAGAGMRRRTGSARGVRSFKGAEVSRIYSDWFASLASPDDDIRGDLRRLRGRARQLDRDNPYIAAYREGLTTNVLTPGIGMDMRPMNRNERGELLAEENERIREAWYEWATEERVTVDGLQTLPAFEELLLPSVAIDGEAFPRSFAGDDLPHGLGLGSIDPDLVDDAYNLRISPAHPEIRMGVEMDVRGRRLAYHVFDDPAYTPVAARIGHHRIAGEWIDHLFRARRLHQTRGVTWLTRIMANVHIGERYIENELTASAAGAGTMGIVKWQEKSMGPGLAPEKDERETDTDGDSLENHGEIPTEIAPGTIMQLPRGMDFSGFTPDHPSTAFADFVKAILRGTATGLLVSYHTLTGDLESTSYSSIRAGVLQERAMWRKLQMWWIQSFRQPVFERWLRMALLTGRLELPGGDWRRYRRTLWKPRGWDWVDPQRDATASETLLRLRLTSPQRLCAERGEDFEEILEEWAAAREMAERLGVPLESAAADAGTGAATSTQPGEEPRDDDRAPEVLAAEMAERRTGRNGAAPRSRVSAR